jgi:Flp pilus assembly protein TadD
MKMGRRAIILLFFFGSLGISLGENVVAPTQAEIEVMYTAAAEEVNAGNYGEALKKLDAIDARQPDVAMAKNLRGVALMRMGELGLAEKALQKAKELDPNLWEARFNLAEVPFLQKNWSEARDRFEALAREPNEQRSAATDDLIQFKIYLTWLLQHKERQTNELLQRLKASSATPAYYCAQAALAFQQKDMTEARVNLRAAEKAFPPLQTKLFLESFYEIGWLKKPDGYVPVALEATSETDRAASVQSHLKEAEQAYREGDYEQALQLLQQVDAMAPDQAVTNNLRGEISLAQGDLDKAESSFRNALVADPQLEEARFNLAQIPLRKGDYEEARKQLEELQGAGSGVTGRQRVREQLVRYEIYLTLLLQDRDGAAQKAMEQFTMADETPALYYAQAAWAFKHQNPRQGRNWVANAANLFSPEQNRIFAAPLSDFGWLGNAPKVTPTPTAAFVQVSPSPAAQPAPSATAEKSPVAVNDENAGATQPPLSATPAESPATKKVVREKGKRKHRDEVEQSSAGEDHKTAAKPKEERKPRRRKSASKEASPKPSPTPSPRPAATPEATRRAPLQQFGETVVHVLTSPFRRRATKEPSPTPSPSMTIAPHPGP